MANRFICARVGVLNLIYHLHALCGLIKFCGHHMNIEQHTLHLTKYFSLMRADFSVELQTIESENLFSRYHYYIQFASHFLVA